MQGEKNRYKHKENGKEDMKAEMKLSTNLEKKVKYILQETPS